MIALFAIATIAPALVAGLFVAPWKPGSPVVAAMMAAFFVWLMLAQTACTLHVEMEIRSQPVANMAPEQRRAPGDAGTLSADSPIPGVTLGAQGIVISDGGITVIPNGTISFDSYGCITTPVGCESPCVEPAVGYAIRYDGCHWVAYEPEWRLRQ